jgi:hypothetical protein
MTKPIFSKSKISIELTEKEALIILLGQATELLDFAEAQGEAIDTSLTREDRDIMKEGIDLLSNYVADIKLTFKGRGFEAGVSYKTDNKGIRDKIQALLENRVVVDIIKLVLKPKRKKKETKEKGNYKSSGHLFDNLLKYTKPSKGKKDNQLQLWGSLSPDTLEKINKEGVEKKEVYEGLNLTASETKLIHTLAQLLHEKSQTSNPKGEDYYTGNLEPIPMEIKNDIGKVEVKRNPALSFTLFELAKLYSGGKNIGGKDVDNVMNVLQSLSNRHFLMIYTETYPTKSGQKIELRREGFHKLIHINKLTATRLEGADIKTILSEKVEIELHSIFRDQIDTKFITLPKDITRRTAIAYGSEAVSKEALQLRDYIARTLSAKTLPKDKEGNYYHEIGVEKLYFTLAEGYMKQGRRKKVQEATNKALETVQNLGMIHGYRVETGATGEPKFILRINKGWK